MIGMPWKKRDTHGGYAVCDVLKMYMMNSELITLEDLLDSGQSPLVSIL